MSGEFSLISEDFKSDLGAISDLVRLVSDGGGSSKSRVASVNSATLLLAATFEEFVREMARQYAREIVLRVAPPENVPKRLAATAWKRTLENIARAKIDSGGTPTPFAHIAAEARAQFETVCRFIEGDVTQDIYKHIAHNENNMRPEQINSIFKVSDLKNFCEGMCGEAKLLEYFSEDNVGRCYQIFQVVLNDFMEKRNDIAHSLNPYRSESAEQFLKDVQFLGSVADAMASFLEKQLEAGEARPDHAGAA